MSQVRSVFQDNKGYLWIGTLGGLSKYDGVEFKNYSVQDGLLGNQIDCIFQDRTGKIWFGTRGGVSMYDGFDFHNILIREFQDFYVRSIIEDQEGNLWISSDGNGVCKLSSDSVLKHYNVDYGLNVNFVRSSAIMDNGRLLFGTKEGLNYFENDSFHVFGNTILDSLNVSSILGNSLNDLWIGSYGEGLIRVKGKEVTVLGENEGLLSSNVNDIIKDVDGSIWILTSRGITHYNDSNFLNYTLNSGLPTIRIRTGIIDEENNLWFGTNGTGLLKYSGSHFVGYTQDNGLSSNQVMSFIEDNNENIWLSTYDRGLMMYDGSGFKYYNTSNTNLGTERIFSSFKDHQGNLWFGTHSGAIKYDGHQFSNISEKNGLFDTDAYAVSQDLNGNMWIGGRDGVAMIYNDSLVFYDYRDSSIGRNITKILCDDSGIMWFASANGLYQYKNSVFKKISMNIGWGTNEIMTLALDSAQNLWMGTSGGLVFFDRNDFKLIDLKLPSKSGYINSLVIDHQNRLWASSNIGLYRFSLDQFYLGNTVEFEHFSNKMGIRSLECNQNASYIDSKGKVWIGTENGVNIYNPRLEKYLQRSPPKINISSIDLFFRPIKWKNHSDFLPKSGGFPSNLELPYNENYMSFHYSGIDLVDPGELVYRFRLDGFDDNWLPETKSREAIYPNLPPGNYRFKVQTRRNNENWNKASAIFKFKIIPPFWNTWWFYMLISIILTLILILLIKTKVNLLEQQRKIEKNANQTKMLSLEQQTLNASMNRHFVFNSLNSIQYYINSNDRLSANTYLTKFAKLIRRNLNSAETTSVLLVEEIERIKLYLALEHMRFEDDFSYKIEIDPSLESDLIRIPSMILQPFIENSILHGVLPLKKKGLIKVKMQQNKDILVLSVIDNGIGISESLRKKGLKEDHISKGMRITKERLALLGVVSKDTRIKIAGPEDHIDTNNIITGTIVEISLPLDEHYLSQM